MRKIFCVVFGLVVSFVCLGGVNVQAVEVSAKACVMVESTTGTVLYEKNSHEELPMASTTKIMTTLLCLESGDLDSQFVVDSQAIKVEGSSMGLVEGDIVTKRALCYGMLLPSGNDSANATAVKVGGTIENFVAMMNERAKSIGMEDTLFVTPSGLDSGEHHSTAYDMALLTREALKNSDFREICSQQTAQVNFGNPPYDRWLKNSNKLLSMYDGVIGVKTGFTDDAGRCLVSACVRDGVTLIVVTLNDPDDWNDHMALYDYGFTQVSLSEPKQSYFSMDVVGGTSDSVTLTPIDDVKLPTIQGELCDYSIEVNVPQFEYAPIQSGEVVGYVEYTLNGEVLATSQLATTENISRKTTPVKRSLKQKFLRFIYRLI